MEQMTFDEAIRNLRKLREIRVDQMGKVNRMRKLRPSVQAMWMADVQRQLEALDFAIVQLIAIKHGPQG